MINGLMENIYIKKAIDEFKERGVLVFENDNTRFYEVKKTYDFEDNTKHIITDYESNNVGSKTDIFVTSRNPLPGDPIMNLVSKYIWIGHAGMVIDDEGKTTIEITGNSSNNTVSIYNNTWLTDSIDSTKEIALLRLKDIDKEKEDKIIDYLHSKIGYSYNYSFFFNRSKSFYCTDLMSRAAKSADVDINYDYLATTGADIFASNATYLVYYREKVFVDGEVKFNVYYLGKEN